MKPKVSIVIPAYNAEKTIKRTIDSVIEQSYDNIEVIVINDGSIDGTTKIIGEYKEKIIVYNNKNNGVSYSRNFGVDHSSGMYVLFIDADDTIDKNFVEKMVENLGDDLLIGGKVRKVLNNNIIDIQQKDCYSREEMLHCLIKGEIDGFCYRYLFLYDFLKDVKFNTKLSYMEDTIFLFNYIFKNKDLKKIIFVNSYYYYNENTYSVTNQENSTLKNMINIKNSMNELLKYDKILRNIDISYYYYNRLAKLYESQIYKITKKDEYINVFNNNEFYDEIIILLKNKKVELKWRIFYFILLNSPYRVFMLYKIFRKKIKERYCRR